MTNFPASDSAAADGTAAPPARLMSLDALRGFDMFWIVGADELAKKVLPVWDTAAVRGAAEQCEHVEWAGFHFEDLIFPMFVFIVGVSLVFSLGRTIERHGRAAAAARVVKRGVLLFLLGVFYYGGFGKPFAEIRLLGVLQRIALAYLFAGLVFCYVGRGGRVAVCAALLVGYWALMTFVPVPGLGAGHFEPGENLANWVDEQYLPLWKYPGDVGYDPEGLLSTLPAVASCLLGVFAGGVLKSTSLSDRRKVPYLLAGGAASALAGWLWDVQFPVIKKLWTSSFVLVAAGYSSILLGLFYLIIDVWKCRKWALPFVWIGMNPITIYMIHNLMDIDKLAERFVGGDVKGRYLGAYGELTVAAVGVVISFAICRFLYRREIFLRL
jgi:predicted acyltransferase